MTGTHVVQVGLVGQRRWGRQRGGAQSHDHGQGENFSVHHIAVYVGECLELILEASSAKQTKK